jgi:hypothetical protein
MVSLARQRPRYDRILHWIPCVATAGALAVDAFVHGTSAGGYDAIPPLLLSKGNLFRAEAMVAIAVALLLLIWARWWSWAVALGVSATALGAVTLYRYVNVGSIGPIPNLYEPTWQVPGKVLSAGAEAVAVMVTASVLWRLLAGRAAGAIASDRYAPVARH